MKKFCQRCKKEYKPQFSQINIHGYIGFCDLFCFSCFLKEREEYIDKQDKKKNKAKAI